MKTRFLSKVATSSLVLGMTLVGCQTTGKNAVASASKPAETAAGNAAAARAALAAAQSDRAIARAEAAVTASPQDAGYRALLAQAYLVAGRFQSAQTAYNDTLTLDPANGRARLSLALTQVALGQVDAARATLAQVPADVPVADVGLAYALAGDRTHAVEMLTNAAREEGASAKTRQNLALVYALSGMWVEARTTAAIDLPADKVGDRMASWSLFAQPRTQYEQVATLLGVQPVVDAGQPQSLALNTAVAAEPVALAQADPVAPAPVAAAAAEVPAQIAQADPTPVAEVAPKLETAQFDAPIEPMATPLMTLAAADPSPFVKAPERPAPLILAPATPIKTTTRAIENPLPVASHNGNWVVQLGAFSTAPRVEVAWTRALGRMQTLGGFSPSSTTYVSTRRSATFYRLSIAGFGSRAEAVTLCERVRAVGGVCFVRGTAGDAPVQWVSRRQPAEA